MGCFFVQLVGASRSISPRAAGAGARPDAKTATRFAPEIGDASPSVRRQPLPARGQPLHTVLLQNRETAAGVGSGQTLNPARRVGASLQLRRLQQGRIVSPIAQLVKCSITRFARKSASGVRPSCRSSHLVPGGSR